MKRAPVLIGLFAVVLLAAGAGYTAGITVGGEPVASAPELEPTKNYYQGLDEAVAAASAGERGRARELFLQLIGQFPARPEVFYNLGLTYEYDEDGARYKDENLLASAAAYYQSALDLDPGFLPARYNLAVLWHKLGYADEAARHYRLVIAAGGYAAPDAEYNLALLLKGQGRAAEAAGLLENSKTSLDDPARVRLLALLAEDQGDVGRAIALWKRMLALEDQPPFNYFAQKRLATLRGY